MPEKVVIVVVTHNHEKYIQQAIESILNQKINFSYKIIIADDGSTDKTLQIVKSYHARFPMNFEILRHEENQGVLANVLRIIPKVNAKYFAILDGDDLWSYDLKLQKQVDFLDQNEDFNGVFHDCEIIHENNTEKILFSHKRYYSQAYNFPEVIHPSDLIKRQIILPSSSALIRTSALKNVDTNMLDNYSLLWKLTCFLIKNSKFYFINQAWSVYHNHRQGISKSNNQDFHYSHVQFLKHLLTDDYYKYYCYELYLTMVNEYRILLEAKSNSNKKTKRKLLRKYIVSEIHKIWHYKKRIINQDV